MDHLSHIRYLDSLSYKEQRLVYKISGKIRRGQFSKGVQVVLWTPAIKAALNLHKQVRKAQARKRLKNKQRNSRH